MGPLAELSNDRLADTSQIGRCCVEWEREANTAGDGSACLAGGMVMTQRRLITVWNVCRDLMRVWTIVAIHAYFRIQALTG